jgi:hypothetical protein
MTADTDKKPALGGKNQQPPANNPPGINKKNVIIGLVLVVLLVIFAITKLHVGQKVYAQADGHKIYKHDVEKLIDGQKSITVRQAATVLADKYLSQAMAKEYGVTVNSADAKAAYGSDFEKLKSTNPYSYQLLLNQLYFNKLQQQNQGVYKGQLLVAQFSRNIVVQPLTPEQQAADPDLGNPAAIESDKKYAQNLITDLRDQIAAGEITFAQAAQTEANDPTVGTVMYPSLSHSGPFNTGDASISRNKLIQASSAMEQIRKMRPGQTSKPFVVSVGSTGRNTVESYFLVVKLESSKGGNSTMSFDQELASSKDKFGYKVNV